MVNSVHVLTKKDISSHAPVLLVALSDRFETIRGRIIETAQALDNQARPYAVATTAGSLLHSALAAANLNVITLPPSKLNPRLYIDLLKTMTQSNIEVVDTYDTAAHLIGAGAALVTGVPRRIASVHAGPRAVRPGFGDWLRGSVLRLNALSGSQFIAGSQALSDYVRTLGAKQINVIYNGVEWSETGRVKDEVSAESHPSLKSASIIPTAWPQDSYILTFVGQLSDERGVSEVIDAVYHGIHEHPQLRCLIVGDGKMRAKLLHRIEAFELEKYIHVAERPADLSTVWQHTDAFCLPAHADGLSTPLFEAGRRQIPLLVTNTNSISELFTHKATAYIADVGNVLELADGIDWLISYPDAAAAIGRNAHDQLQRRLAPHKMVDATLTLYA